MNLQHLPDIHTGRHAQRVQHNIQRPAVRKKRHILYRKHTGNHTLVSMTSCHLITHRNFSLLGNINADCLVYAGRQLIPVFSGKHTGIYYDTIFTVRHFQGSIPYLSRLLAKNSSQQPLFGRQLCLAFRCNLTYQDISGTHFRANADDTTVIQVFKRIISNARHISGNLLRPQLRIPRLSLILFNMNRRINIVHNQPFTQQYGILVVVTFPCHKANQRILSKSDLAIRCRRPVCNHLPCCNPVAFVNNRSLVVAVALVTS